MSEYSVKDKVVVITGGYGVLGGALAESFAESESKVVILGRNQEKLDAKVSALKNLNAEASGYKCDVTSKEQLEDCAENIVAQYGSIDVLINVAGGNTPGGTQGPDQSIFDLNIEDVDSVIDLNSKGTIYPSLILGRVMAENGKGSIINISSMATYTALTRVMGYSVAKTGINMFTQWMACEMAKKYGDKIRVNAIAPGFFVGEQNRKVLFNEDGSLSDRSKLIINGTPMGRFGDISELNGITKFLCSDAASFITGTIIPVDGGFSAFSGV